MDANEVRGRTSLVNTKQKASRLDGRLERLDLDGGRLVEAVLLHVDDLARLSVNSELVLAGGVLGLQTLTVSHVEQQRVQTATDPQLGQDADRVSSAVLDERPRDDLHRLSDGAERPALDTLDRARHLGEADGDGHFCRASARGESRVEDDVARDGHGVREVSVDLMQDVL